MQCLIFKAAPCQFVFIHHLIDKKLKRVSQEERTLVMICQFKEKDVFLRTQVKNLKILISVIKSLINKTKQKKDSI